MGNELTEGPVTKSMLRFAVPIILGDLLQQCYNIADTVIVGRFLGADALAAVGSSFSLMTFLTSILLGLAMGSGTVFSIRFGQKDRKALKECVLASFVLLFAVTVFLTAVIFAGMFGIFLYNFFAALLRSLGNSVVPLIFLAVSAGLNIGLDLWFVAGLEWGVAGAAGATVISQYVSGIGIAVYTRVRFPELIRKEKGIRLRKERIREITGFSALTCLQQSIMNLGILAVQGLVNSFGTTIMAAFAAAVKIDAFAYLPVQDFGNAFSVFVAQNYGAGKKDRIQKGIRSAVKVSAGFGLLISLLVVIFARPLMTLFIDAREAAVVALAYGLAAIPSVGVTGIWCSVPIGWFLADALGTGYYLFWKKETTLGGREKNFLKKSARIFCLIMVKLLQAVFEGVAADAVNHCLKSSFGKIPPAENQIHGCQAQGNEFQFREKGGIQTCAQAGVGGFG